MQRDLKIGLFAGLLIAGAVMVYICTRPSLSPRARILNANFSKPRVQPEFEPEPKTEPIRQQAYPLPDLSGASEPVRHIEPLPEPIVTQKPASVIIQESKPQPEPTTYASTERIKTTRFYIVRKRDTLSKISKRYYGSANKWHKIYEANRNVLGKNPDLLKPGTKLVIPD